MKKPIAALTLGLLATLASCGVLESQEHTGSYARSSDSPPEPVALGSIERAHTHDGIYLTSQPNEPDLGLALAMGIQTVVNLRPDSEQPDFEERRIVQQLGLNYVYLPIDGADGLTDANFDAAREIFEMTDRPMLVHCSSANRVAAVWMPWRVLDLGVPYERSLEEAAMVGLTKPELEDIAADYIRRNIQVAD